jgi:tetratricopeptide (TPR) repeat protein
MFAWILLIGVGLSAAEGVAPVAMVTGIKGQVTQERGKDKVPLDEADLLLPGDRVTTSKDGEVVLVFLTGDRRLRVKGGQTVTVDEKGCTPAEALEEIEGARKVAEQQLRSIYNHAKATKAVGGRAAAGVLRGGDLPDAALRAATPMFGTRLMTDHPTLSWPKAPGKVTYEVTLLSGGEPAKVIWKTSTDQTTLPYPEDEKVLEWNQLYRWRVVARQGEEEKEIVESRFFTLSKKAVEDLTKLRPLTTSDEPSDWLLAATAYEAAGGYDRALPLFEKLAARAPKSANYQEALAAYYERAGQKEQAATARKKAEALRPKAGK